MFQTTSEAAIDNRKFSHQWREQAHCRGMDTEIFFPDSFNTQQFDKIKQLCQQCPVQQQCREYAVAAGEKFGVWGGTNATERRRLTAALRTAPAAKLPPAVSLPLTAKERKAQRDAVLCALYDKGYSLEQIAAMHNLSSRTVLRALQRTSTIDHNPRTQ